MRALDERLASIAKRPVDINNPNWAEELKQRPHPLDEAGVRGIAVALLEELALAYARVDGESRAAIRGLFSRFTSFAWAATLAQEATTADGFRLQLLHFSMLDQGRDPRDATLWLDRLVQTARFAGVSVEAVLQEGAASSSEGDRYGWGSTADWLLARATPEEEDVVASSTELL